MAGLRDDERRLLKLLNPLLEFRAAGSAVLLVAVFIMALLNYHVTWPMFICLFVIVVAVNFLSFFFIEKGAPVKAFIIMNGTLFTAIITIGVYYTGGDKSPLMLVNIILIVLSSMLSGSMFITLAQTFLIILSFNVLIFLDMKDIIEIKQFFMNVRFTYWDKYSPMDSMMTWNVFFVIIGALFSSVSHVLRQVRRELQDALTEISRLNKIVKSLVSRSTWSDLSEAARGGEEKLKERREQRAILFSDIVGFSTISENIKAEEVVAMLNLHFQEMSEIVYRQDGDIDKFIGDSVMAVFDDPVKAVAAGLQMQHKTIQNNRAGKEWDPLTKVRIRVGINWGDVVIGNMGTEERMDRSLIGDAVNIAQRLESLATPGHILVSESVYNACRENDSGFVFTSVGRVKIKGKKQIIRAWSLNPRRN